MTGYFHWQAKSGFHANALRQLFFLAVLVWFAGINTMESQTAGPSAAPDGMVLIPAGPFMMGDSLDGESNAMPTARVTVSTFYMDTNLTSFSQWQMIRDWATNHGFIFDGAGSGKAANHPVQQVNWYDTAKWCNARSQQAGLTPVYYMDAELKQVYTHGDVNAVYANWAANGYRLPTEAEWEKAARGGKSGQRFPWGNTISERQANYDGKNFNNYDRGPGGHNSRFDSGAKPYTSPVGYFAANGYGLYDMAGNVSEWCWDWYHTPYAGGGDPHGPVSGNCRVVRGGDWDYFAYLASSAHRTYYDPSFALNVIGFRCVRGQ